MRNKRNNVSIYILYEMNYDEHTDDNTSVLCTIRHGISVPRVCGVHNSLSQTDLADVCTRCRIDGRKKNSQRLLFVVVYFGRCSAKKNKTGLWTRTRMSRIMHPLSVIYICYTTIAANSTPNQICWSQRDVQLLLLLPAPSEPLAGVPATWMWPPRCCWTVDAVTARDVLDAGAAV